MSSTPSNPNASRAGGWLARLKGMVQNMKPNDESPRAEEVLPTWDVTPPPTPATPPEEAPVAQPVPPSETDPNAPVAEPVASIPPLPAEQPETPAEAAPVEENADALEVTPVEKAEGDAEIAAPPVA